MAVALTRRRRPGAMISVVPMIDVLMILLIFFMVTSTYLRLDMIPAVQADEDVGDTPPPAGAPPSRVLLVRIGADGRPAIGGTHLDIADLGARVAERLAADPGTQVMVLPSGAADTQALVAVMDAVTSAGAAEVRIVRIAAAP